MCIRDRLFLFFNAEIWQVCNGLDNGRAIAVAAILLALAIVVVVVTALDEIQELIEARSDVVDEADQRRLLAATPLVSYPVPSRRDPLGLGERINVVVLAVAVQVFQVIMFSLVMGPVSYTHLDVYKRQVRKWWPRRIRYMTGSRSCMFSCCCLLYTSRCV